MSSHQCDIAIVGAGAAGIAVAASLKKRQAQLSITLIDPSEKHYYQPGGRDLAFMATVGDHKEGNIHVGQSVTEAEFVAMRESRDATLAMPTLILPSLQVNMRAGHLPPLDGSGRLFLKVPINAFGGPDVQALSADL